MGQRVSTVNKPRILAVIDAMQARGITIGRVEIDTKAGRIAIIAAGEACEVKPANDNEWDGAEP